MAVLALAVVLAVVAQVQSAALPILATDGSSAFNPVICAHYASPVGRLPMDLIALVNAKKYNYTYGGPAVGGKLPACGGNGSGVGKALVVGCPYATSSSVCAALAAASAYNGLPKVGGVQQLKARPLGFGDGQFTIPVGGNNVIPPNVLEIPLAYGAIAIYIQDAQLNQAGCSLSVKGLCQVFGNTQVAWSVALPCASELATTSMTVHYRTTSSGSTNAVAFYLRSSGVCDAPFPGYATPLANNPPTSVPANWVGQATTGSLLTALTVGVFGGVGYASCQSGIAGAPALVEIPVENLVGVSTTCRGCSPANQPAGPGPSTPPYCADYTKFIVTSSFNKTKNYCNWTGVIVDGDKDADGDGGNDTDKEGDGIQPGFADYPMVFLEFGYLNNLPAVSKNTQGTIAKTMICLIMLTSGFQASLPNFGFQPVSAVILDAGCTCCKSFVALPGIMGKYTAGKCT